MSLNIIIENVEGLSESELQQKVAESLKEIIDHNRFLFSIRGTDIQIDAFNTSDLPAISSEVISALEENGLQLETA